jgi:hypothetical protein
MLTFVELEVSPDDEENNDESKDVEGFENNVAGGPGHIISYILQKPSRVEDHRHQKNDNEILNREEGTR